MVGSERTVTAERHGRYLDVGGLLAVGGMAFHSSIYLSLCKVGVAYPCDGFGGRQALAGHRLSIVDHTYRPTR